MTSAAIFPSIVGGVLVASPSPSLREQVRQSLHHGRGPIHEVHGGADALVKLESGDWQLLFLDRRLPDLDAEELIKIIKLRFPGIELVLLDSDSSTPFPVKDAAHGSWRNSTKPALAVPKRGTSTASLSTAIEEPGPYLLSESLPSNALLPLPGMIGDAELNLQVPGFCLINPKADQLEVFRHRIGSIGGGEMHGRRREDFLVLLVVGGRRATCQRDRE